MFLTLYGNLYSYFLEVSNRLPCSFRRTLIAAFGNRNALLTLQYSHFSRAHWKSQDRQQRLYRHAMWRLPSFLPIWKLRGVAAERVGCEVLWTLRCFRRRLLPLPDWSSISARHNQQSYHTNKIYGSVQPDPRLYNTLSYLTLAQDVTQRAAGHFYHTKRWGISQPRPFDNC